MKNKFYLNIQSCFMAKYYIAIVLSWVTFSSYAQPLFKVKIDPRFEAISLFYTLSTVDTLNIKPTPSTYYRDVKNHFASCRLNASLEWYRKLDKWDNFDVASFGIYLSEKYPFKVTRKIETNYIRSAPVDTFLHHLNQFYKDCGVNAFLVSHQREYDRIVAQAQDTIAKSKILEDVIAFFGQPQSGEFVIYLDLLNNLGSNALSLTGLDFQAKRLYRLAYHSDSTANLTNRDPVVFNPYLNVVAHECSHSFVNDFIPRYEQRLHNIRNLFLTTTKGTVLPESEWKNELDELIVRVCVAKVLENRDGKDAGLAEISNQARHFRLAQALYGFFDQYVLHRDRYKTLEQFYPELIAYLEKAAVTQ
jgi:hypothetical protein